MGSVIDAVKCPKCNTEDALTRDYYYKSGEEFGFCNHCGYNYGYYMEHDDNYNIVRELKDSIDLTENDKIFYVKTKRESGKEEVVLYSEPVLPTDTQEDFKNLMNLNLRFENYESVPERFKKFYRTKEEREEKNAFYDTDIYMKKEDGELEQIWYIGDYMEIKDGKFNIHKAKWINEESGGFGVVMKTNGVGGVSIALEEGDVPELDDDVIFATAIVDGELKVLKDTLGE